MNGKIIFRHVAVMAYLIIQSFYASLMLYTNKVTFADNIICFSLVSIAIFFAIWERWYMFYLIKIVVLLLVIFNFLDIFIYSHRVRQYVIFANGLKVTYLVIEFKAIALLILDFLLNFSTYKKIINHLAVRKI